MKDKQTIWWKRLTSNLIDIFLIGIIIALSDESISGTIGSACGIYIGGSGAILGIILENQTTEDLTNTYNIFIFYFILITFLWIQEVIFGQTIGKFALGIKVVDEEGNKPNFFVLLFRQIFKLFPFARISMLSKNPRGLHNLMTNTYVVEKNNTIKIKNLVSKLLLKKGSASHSISNDGIEKINKLYEMKEKGIITDKEFNEEKSKILNR